MTMYLDLSTNEKFIKFENFINKETNNQNDEFDVVELVKKYQKEKMRSLTDPNGGWVEEPILFEEDDDELEEEQE